VEQASTAPQANNDVAELRAKMTELEAIFRSVQTRVDGMGMGKGPQEPYPSALPPPPQIPEAIPPSIASTLPKMDSLTEISEQTDIMARLKKIENELIGIAAKIDQPATWGA
jgi:hypothetical protein